MSKMILVCLEPIILQGTYSRQVYTKDDPNPIHYQIMKPFIEKYGLEIGDDMAECLSRHSGGVEPVRPEPTEEQKATKPISVFSSNNIDYD